MLQPLNRAKRLHSLIGVGAKARIVLYQGGYYLDTRALDKLVESAQYYPDNVILVLIGFALRGEDEILRSLAERLRLGDRVRFLPPVPHQELLSFTMDADVGVIPFYDNAPAMHWCTPNKIYEYLMAGIATASTDLPEIRAIIEKHDVGALFDPTDPRSIARAICDLTADPVRLEAMKRRARAAAESEYHWGLEAQKLLDLYDRLAAGRVR